MIKIVKRLAAVERALRDAAPHRLVEALRPALTTLYGVESVELLLVDYGLTVLQPVGAVPRPAAAVALHNTAAGRAFGSQEPFAEDVPAGRVRLHLPVTVRGDRLGVLRLTAPAGACDTAALAELADVAEVLGREVLVAERDTDLYLQARRRSRLTLAAEMQWRLLPGHSRVYEEFAWGAHLEPAHAIHGDNFDLSATHDRLTRNARRAGIGVADRAALADQAVFAQYRGKAYAASLLLDFEVTTGRVQVVDAGSPRLWRLRAGAVEPIGFEAQLPLGMFEETDYIAQEFQVEPGDRLVFASDGVYAGASRAGERALVRAIASARLLSAAETPRAVLRELTGHRHTGAPDTDALVLCLDWYGR